MMISVMCRGAPTSGSMVLQSLDKVGNAKAIAIAEALKSGITAITSLNLAGNQLCGLDRLGRGTYDATGIQALAAALAGSTALTDINLAVNNIGSQGATAIAEALKLGSTALKSINLSFNELDSEAGKALASMLEANTALTHLNLDSNNIGNAGAIAIAEALKSGTTALKSIDLSHNRLDADADRPQRRRRHRVCPEGEHGTDVNRRWLQQDRQGASAQLSKHLQGEGPDEEHRSRRLRSWRTWHQSCC